jgi:hypothetical protein
VTREEPEELARRLFDAARGEQPAARAREQAIERLLARRTAGTSRRTLVALGLLAASVCLAVGLTRSSGPKIGAEGLRSMSPLMAKRTEDAKVSLAPVPDLPSVASAPSASRAEKPAPREAASAPHAVTLEEETSALDRVQAELRAGHGSVALALLDRYDRADKGGSMAAEAELLRIQALASVGRSVAAAELAQKLVRMYPNSPLVDRAREYLPSPDAGDGWTTTGENGRTP